VFLLKGRAADAIDTPQPEGSLCNLVMKMISFFLFFQVMEHLWNETDKRKPKYSAKNLSDYHFVHHISHTD
jgi:hypothetical protein